MHHAVLLAGVIVFASVPGHLHAQVFGMVGAEVRLFPSSPLLAGQSRHSGSLVFRPEFRHDWARGRQSVVFEGFLRLDAADEQRSKVDIRELTYQQAWTAFELTVGIGRVFWGVTESQHLVDIVNQTDLVENIDREEKLGQPMVNVALVQNWGTVGLFVLPGFREQTFPGVQAVSTERYPVDPRSGYTRQIVWYDLDEYRPLRIDYYDRKDDLLKTLTYEGYQQYLGQYWRADAMHMVNHQNGKSTILTFSDYEFRVGLTDRDFDQNSLRRAG